MKFQRIAALTPLLLSVSALLSVVQLAASINPNKRSIAAQKSNRDFLRWKENRTRSLAANFTNSITTKDERDIIATIDVYYHIFISNATNGDDVPDETLEKQTAILNEAFSGKASTFYPTDCDGNPMLDGIDTGFRFNLAGITRNEDSIDGVLEGLLSLTDEQVTALYMDVFPDAFSDLQGLHGNLTLLDEAAAKLERFKAMNRTEQFLTVLAPENLGVFFIIYGHTQHEGDCSTLNIWVIPGESMGTVYGVSRRPHWCPTEEMFLKSDGILLHRGALPDSNFFPEGNPNDLSIHAYDVAERGDTLVHEVGHWLNLEHPDAVMDAPSTGRTGCDFLTGDFVIDTPAAGMATATYCQAFLGIGPDEPCCPVEADTCPHRPGLDPATNYMSYSSDCCTNSFTEGQILRMQHSWEAYRRGTSQESASSSSARSLANCNSFLCHILSFIIMSLFHLAQQ